MIHLSKADITQIEEHYVLDALRSGWIAPLGPHVDRFEAEIAEMLGCHTLALSSGTAALHLALLEIGARPGTVVLCPTMTFAATANAICYTGARPVFVDCLLEDGNVDPACLDLAVETLISEGQVIAGFVSVDLFGRAADYGSIEEILSTRGIPLVEDAAEALGASYRGQMAGSFGKAAALSFNGNKIITTSGGGMLVSRDADLIQHARKLSTQAREDVAWYEHNEVGYNYRMSNLLAALGRAQLSRLPDIINKRSEIRARYLQGFKDLPLIPLVPSDDVDRRDNHWLTCVRITEEHRHDIDNVIRMLNVAGIEARHLWKPLHQQPVFSDDRSFIAGNAEHLFTHGFALPSGTGLTLEDVDFVVEHVRAIFGE